jgi:hypothetical protein
MTTKTTANVLRAVTQRVLDSFTAQGALFTGLDVSNVVKNTCPDVRHRDIAPLVRELYERGAMGEYTQTLIDVMANGATPAQAYLYHLAEYDASLYDDAHRSQLAIPPVSTNTDKNDDRSITNTTLEAPVALGRDGRGRVPRQILLNAGIVGDAVFAVSDSAPERVVLSTPTGLEEETPSTATLEYEHPSLLHLPRRLMNVFTPGSKFVARIVGGRVEVVGV